MNMKDIILAEFDKVSTIQAVLKNGKIIKGTGILRDLSSRTRREKDGF